MSIVTSKCGAVTECATKKRGRKIENWLICIQTSHMYLYVLRVCVCVCCLHLSFRVHVRLSFIETQLCPNVHYDTAVHLMNIHKGQMNQIRGC